MIVVGIAGMRAVDFEYVVGAVVLGWVVSGGVGAAVDVNCILREVVGGTVVTAVLPRFVDVSAAVDNRALVRNVVVISGEVKRLVI